MKIKYRIAILFTALVTLILLFVCISIYYFSNLNRELDFRRRIRNRALSTISLLVKVEGMDKALLKRIDENTLISLKEKSVVVYDNNNREIYHFRDEGVGYERPGIDILNKARESGEYIYSTGHRDAIAISYKSGTQQYVAVAASYDEMGLEKLAQLKFILLLSFVSGSLITFLSGLIFSSRLVRPIKKITNEVNEISSQNLSRRIMLGETKDELYELSYTFNQLLTRLQESFEIQRRFIANASHELSTPLTSISSQLEITLQNQRNAEEYQQIIQSVYDDVKNLNRLTRSLLELAKASGTSDGMELTLVRMDEMLMKLPVDLHKTSDRYKVELDFETFPDNEDSLLAFGNGDLLESAIKNVVLNACKYSNNNTANVALKFSDNQLHIIVSDNGPGILKEHQSLIFQPFFRSEKSNSPEGFGLGLSLAYRIIKLHKGNISFEEASPNGSIFTITLPIARNFHLI
ncbi:sensor histidine kinase [Sediminibacterium goheungense]|uniref:histidine kinase n=1 Tax=Sediminibacterium goheungense TaxID=1086393 RepID=A0A4R6IZN7_9BACT|nr:HAMP domain-containing sensor histidine kinase [Sediminibacterium goheungense]TDO27967.1 signal transduction histidine kinase [Sediminibacterium goheungense]